MTKKLDKDAVEMYTQALAEAKKQGAMCDPLLPYKNNAAMANMTTPPSAGE